LLDRGDAQGLCVICPPHLCDQWQEELETKFHIHAKVVRTSTLARLERDLPRRDLSVYKYYKHLVVSISLQVQTFAKIGCGGEVSSATTLSEYKRTNPLYPSKAVTMLSHSESSVSRHTGLAARLYQ
jgi:hypothetical protein